MIATCPPRNALEAYLLGNVDDDSVETHLGECADCQAALDVLDAEVNRPFACLRAQAPATADWMEPTYRQLVEQAKALSHQDGPALEQRTLGNYRLLEVIGKGGFGVVYKAMHERLKKTVVVKLLAPGHADSADNRARFQQEMVAVGRLASPHIIAAHDAGEIDGQLLLVMEYVEGRTLTEVVRQDGPLPMDRALDCVLQAARGLAHAHAAGIVHRDVKPSNLLLDAKGTVKVLDLGLARFLFEASSENAIMGTPMYMAPELFDGRVADERADIYSLGCTMYHLVTGKFLYRSDDWKEILAGHRDAPIPPLTNCPRTVDNLFRRLVAKKPEDRPASMQAVVDELEKIVGKKTVKRAVGHGLIAATILIAASLLMTLTMWLSGGFLGDPKKDKDNGVTQPKKGATPEVAMVLIVAGDFFMGASDSDARAHAAEKPVRKVKINKAFLLGKFEITQAQYQEVIGSNPSAFSKNGANKARVKDLDTSKHPVESTSWLDAIRFCIRLSERHELKPYYKISDKEVVTIQGGDGYRLPTEAEWEYACRAGAKTTWHFGENAAELKEHAWFAENSGDRTHPVGQKKANPWGLHDMLGNVPEWVWDRFDEKYYAYMPASDPPGSGSSQLRSFRGDAWNSLAPRPTARQGLGLTYASGGSINLIGFRVARNAE